MKKIDKPIEVGDEMYVTSLWDRGIRCEVLKVRPEMHGPGTQSIRVKYLEGPYRGWTCSMLASALSHTRPVPEA